MLFIFETLGIEPRALYMVDKHSLSHATACGDNLKTSTCKKTTQD